MSIDKMDNFCERCDENRTESQTFCFTPSLQKQRHEKVLTILERIKPAKIVDFGCASCDLLSQLINEQYASELCGVDVDGSLLESASWKMQPRTYNYLHPRLSPLTITLFKGSIAVKDFRLQNFDTVLCIELIEHLENDVLEKVPESIFGFIRPQRAVISTPNVEFNVVFNNPTARLRHWDHKFEWTRRQFDAWCDNICQVYGYTVEYDGVGVAPDKYPDVGFASQFAIFAKIESKADDVRARINVYDVIREITYPHKRVENVVEDVVKAAGLWLSHQKRQNSDPLTDKPLSIRRGANVKSRTFGSTLFQISVKCLPFRKAVFDKVLMQFQDAWEVRPDNKLHKSIGSNLYGHRAVPAEIFPLIKSACSDNLKHAFLRYSEIKSSSPEYHQFEDCDDSNVGKFDIFRRETLPAFPHLATDVIPVYRDPVLDVRVSVTQLDLGVIEPHPESDLLFTNGRRLLMPFSFFSTLDRTLHTAFGSRVIPTCMELCGKSNVEIVKSGVVVNLDKFQCLRRADSIDSVVSSKSSYSIGEENDILEFKDFEEESWDA